MSRPRSARRPWASSDRPAPGTGRRSIRSPPSSRPRPRSSAGPATSRCAACSTTAACATSRPPRCSPRCTGRSAACRCRHERAETLRGSALPATTNANSPLDAVMADPRTELQAYFLRSKEAVEKALVDPAFMAAVVNAAAKIAASLKNGGKVLFAGNGGSAADAQHIAAEFVGRFINDRAPLAAIALTTDTSALTAIGNDYGFDRVFERQLRALGRKGDVFV